MRCCAFQLSRVQVAADGVGGGGSSAYSQERAALAASSLSLGRLLANPVARLAVAVVLLGGVFSALQLTGGSSLEQAGSLVCLHAGAWWQQQRLGACSSTSTTTGAPSGSTSSRQRFL